MGLGFRGLGFKGLGFRVLIPPSRNLHLGCFGSMKALCAEWSAPLEPAEAVGSAYWGFRV